MTPLCCFCLVGVIDDKLAKSLIAPFAGLLKTFVNSCLEIAIYFCHLFLNF